MFDRGRRKTRNCCPQLRHSTPSLKHWYRQYYRQKYMFTEPNLQNSPYLQFRDFAANVTVPVHLISWSDSRRCPTRVLGEATRRECTFCHLKTPSGPNQK